MFTNRKSKSQGKVDPSTSENRINEGTIFVGDIESNGFFRIDGVVEGNIKSPARVVIGKKGAIKGFLQCDSADVEGKIDGELKITETLTLRSTASINGDVTTAELVVEPGAELNGNCNMQANVKTLNSKNDKSKQEKKKKVS